MYGLCCNLFFFLTIVALQAVLGEVADKRKEKIDAIVSLPINSKFWNPQLDDKTNMELIGIQYLDDSNKTVIEVSDKSAQLSQTGYAKGENRTTGVRPRRGDRFFVWGLLNLLKPWGNALPDGNLRKTMVST